MTAVGNVFGLRSKKACAVIQRVQSNVINAFHGSKSVIRSTVSSVAGGWGWGSLCLKDHTYRHRMKRHNSFLSRCSLLRIITFLCIGLKSEVAFCCILEPSACNCRKKGLNRSGK